MLTPLENTLIDIWPQHDRWTSGYTWRVVRARLFSLNTLLLYRGIADSGTDEEILDDLTTLYAIAAIRQIDCEAARSYRRGAVRDNTPC